MDFLFDILYLDSINYLLYEGESKCGGIKLPKCTKYFTGHKWLHFEAQAERSEARALKKPRVPSKVLCTLR